ncbi:MAG: tRNA pseudouridine(38-40) synthase TruA [Chloroflexota bacterium]
MPAASAASFALLLEYDGTAFYGSQLQPCRRTVQGELEAALARLTQQHPRVALAGRTDTGVHALGQVASLTVATRLTAETLERALNAVLPADLAVRRCSQVSPSFHARFSAIGREYYYDILERPQRSPLERHRAYHVRQALDVAAMDAACRQLLGRQDFASFSGAGRRDRTVRTVKHATCLRAGEKVRVAVAADAFLPHMVRNIVGTLIWLGTGKLDLPGFVSIVRAAERKLAGPTAPPQGLYLARVNYGDEWQGVFA